jgi:rod shape-determining protein MreC
MPRKTSNRVLTLVVVTLLLLSVLLLSALPGSPLNFLTTPLSTILQPIQSVLSLAVDKTGGFFEALSEGIKIREENKALKNENAALKSQIDQLEEAGRQYAQLKEAFKLKDQFDRYQIIGARILTREIGTWFDVFRIDAGTKDGLSVSETTSFAVLDAQSCLVGRVLSTDLLSGKVLPLLHEGFSVSAKTNVINGALMRVRGDYDLKPQGLCLVDQIPQGAVIKAGDELITSGEGGVFPAGIPIGKIVSVIENDSQRQRQAYLKPYADLENLATVFVLVGKNS